MIFEPLFQEYFRSAPYELEELIDRAGILTITLVNGALHRITVSFDSYMAYRKLDEGDALLTLSDISRTGGTAKYLYRVEDSSFLAWFAAERCDNESIGRLTHFTIAAVNDIVDVLAIEPPVLCVSTES